MQKANDVNLTIKAYRLFVFLLIGAFVVTNFVWVIIHNSSVNDLTNRVYVRSESGTTVAIADPVKVSAPEAKAMIKNFMSLMFSHDAGTFKEHVNLALNLIEHNDGVGIYDTFKRGKVYENYVKFASKSEWIIDSVTVDVGITPMQGRVYGVQKIMYDKEYQLKPLAAKIFLEQWPRSDENPYGVRISDFVPLNYIREEKK